MGRQRQDPERVELGGIAATVLRSRGTDAQGRAYWRARRLDESREDVWTGRGTRAEVEGVLADLVRRGIPSPRSDPSRVASVSDLTDRWLLGQEARCKSGQIAHRTFINYRQAARYWKGAFGDLSVRALTRVRVEDMVSEWLLDDIAPRTVKLAVDVLAMVVAWGADRELCSAVELSRLSSLRVRDDEHVAVSFTPSREQVVTVLSHLRPDWRHAMIAVQAYTGARMGEVAALTVGDWDRRASELVISGRDVLRERRGKSKPRRWPVLREFGELLDRLAGGRAPSERLIEGMPKEYVAQLADALRLACDKSAIEGVQVPRFTTHGIRRQVAMELLEQGNDAKSVSELTGHSVATLLRFYVRPTSAKLRDIVARASLSTKPRKSNVRRLRAQVSGTPDE